MKKRTVIILMASVVLLCAYFVFIGSICRTSGQFNVLLSPEIKEISIEKSVNVAEQVIPVTIQNKSIRQLSSEENIFLSYHLLDQKGNMIQFDYDRTDIGVVLVNGKQRVELRFVPPSEVGTYILELDLLEEHVTWFAQKGNPTARVALKVNEPIAART